MTTFPPALKAHTEHLYTVFGKYPLKRHVEGCTCGCLPAAAEVALHRRPLRELGPHELTRYASKAMTTWGDVEDFKHFLPRLLELLVQGELGVQPEITLGKLSYGHWDTWPAQEYAAVSSFLRTWWVALLSQSEDEFFWEADTVLAALARAENDLLPYLRLWDELDALCALRHLADFVLRNGETLSQRELGNVFWEGRAHQAQQVVDWLLTRCQQARLEATAPDAGPHTEVLEQAAYTLSILRD